MSSFCFSSLAALSLLVCYPATGPALAQSAAADLEVEKRDVEEIVVTGSRIKRRDYFTPSPLMTVSEEDIDFSGQWTLEAALNQMPQVTPDFGRAANNPGNGMARIALRNMGPGRSLVLLNGRRVSPSGNRSSVDINNIPQALVERVEIITGGTSAVYGSDALAGVVNFITREDFSGFAVEASASTTEYGDSESYDLSATFGHNFEHGRGNITLYAGIFRREASYAADREHTRIAWREDWEGSLVEGGSGAVPATQIFWPPFYWPDDPEADAPNTTFDADGNPREFIWPDDLYNYAPANYLQIPMDRQAFGLFANYELSDKLESYLEASYTRTDPEQNFAPVPAFGDVFVNLDNPLLTPASAQLFADQFACDVNLACMFLGKRLLELGPRIEDIESDYYRVTAGLRHDLGNDWEIDGWVSYARASRTTFLGNDASYSRLLQGLLVDPVTNQCIDPSGGCVPLDIFGEGRLSEAGVEFIRFRDFENPSERTHKLASVVLSGSPMSTWAGPIDIATGLEWRSDKSEFLVDNALFAGDALGFNAGSPGGGYDTVSEVYLEAVVPLANNASWAEYLGLEVGARYSDYRYAGGVWSYKAGMEWQPWEALRIRAMHQRSVRAPNSFELFEEQRSFRASTYDPCAASEDPIGNGLLDKCAIQGLPENQVGIWEASDFYPTEHINGGNPNLETEVGHTWTVGAVVASEWLPGSSFAIDYYDIKLDGAIGGIDSEEVCWDEFNTEHVFCDRITRDQTGHMSRIVSTTGNKGIMDTQGIDLQANYDADLGQAWSLGNYTASVGINVIWTHLLSFEDQESPATQIYECAGFFGGPCQTSNLGAWGGSDTTFAKNRVRASINYGAGPLNLYLAWRWIDGSKSGVWEYVPLSPGEDLAIKSVGDRQYLDLGAGVSFSDHLSARFGINNLMVTAPPNMADNTWDNNTDTGLYDVFGRSYYLSMSIQY